MDLMNQFKAAVGRAFLEVLGDKAFDRTKEEYDPRQPELFGHFHVSFYIPDGERAVDIDEMRIRYVKPGVMGITKQMSECGYGLGCDAPPLGPRGTGALQEHVVCNSLPMRLTICYDGSKQAHLFSIDYFARKTLSA